LLVIISALLTMFYQTQRAFRLSATQQDVLEGGRTGMEFLTAELPEITPSHRDGQINLYAATMFPFLVQPRPMQDAAPRVNSIQDFYFLRQRNDEWIGTGYFVLPFSTEPIGALYRFQLSVTNVTNNSQIFWLFTNFIAATKQDPPPNSHRIMDRVVNLRLAPYNSQGQFLTNLVDTDLSFTNSFTNSVLPFYLDLEMGILEPRAYEKYKALADPFVKAGNPNRALKYLTDHVEKVHLFRQRIPIRTATNTWLARWDTASQNYQTNWIVP
jgi:hypothetical protein